MSISDIEQAVKLLSEEWDLGSKISKTDKKTCALIYLFEILSETEQLVFYRQNGKMLGFAGYSNNNSKKFIVRKKFYTFLQYCLMHSRKVKNKDGLKKYYENYEYIPENIKSSFDGEVSILILDKQFRSQGIGKKCWKKFFNWQNKME